MLEVRNLDHSVMIFIFKKGLKESSYYFFSKKFPCNLVELFAHANKYINIEERW